jgi:hypothetical protein
MGRARGLIAILILVATAAFVAGSAVERSRHNAASAGAEGSASRELSEKGGGSGEALLGINPESAPVLIVAIALSLLMALAVWRVRSILVLIAAALVAASFGALDIREALHQSSIGDSTLTIVAGVVAALHFAVTIAAGLLARVRPASA